MEANQVQAADVALARVESRATRQLVKAARQDYLTALTDLRNQIGITKSGFGAGVGLMIVPMTVVAMGHLPAYGPAATLGLMLPLLLAGDIIAIGQYRKLFEAECGHRNTVSLIHIMQAKPDWITL